ncbi:MAG: hypothetical protein AABX70_00300 [Nanoarchaeota archaeon]
MKYGWIVIALFLFHVAVVAAEDAENISSIFVKYVTAEELGIDGLSPEKLVVSKLGDTVKVYSFSIGSDVQKALEGIKEEALKQRLSLVKEDVDKKKWVSLPISQQVDIYQISTIYANIDKKAFRSRVRLTVTSPDNYKAVKIVQVYPDGEDISAADFIFNPDDKPVVFKTRDPMLEWNIPLVSPGQVIKLEYYVKDILTNANLLILAFGELYSSAEPLPEVNESAVTPSPENDSVPVTNVSSNVTALPVNTETKFSTAFLLTVLSILALVSVVIAIFHFELKEKAVAEKRKFSENLDNYVKTSLQMGADPKTLRQALSAAGWDPQMVDRLIEHHTKKH